MIAGEGLWGQSVYKHLEWTSKSVKTAADEGDAMNPSAVAHPSEQTWRSEALCRLLDPEMFFPNSDSEAAPALTICRRCPVQAECLAHALTHHEHEGVWGGMTGKARRRLQRKGLVIAAAR